MRTSEPDPGGLSAFRELYEAHAATVFGVACQVTRSRPAAEEIVQDTFITLWSRPDRFDPNRGTMRSYLCAIAHRRSIDWLRSQASRERRERRSTALGADADTTEETACNRADAVQLHRAVASLPSKLRAPLQLAYFGGLTYRQVAEALGLPEGTAKSRLREALRRLAVLLDQDAAVRSA